MRDKSQTEYKKKETATYAAANVRRTRARSLEVMFGARFCGALEAAAAAPLLGNRFRESPARAASRHRSRNSPERASERAEELRKNHGANIRSSTFLLAINRSANPSLPPFE